MMNPYAYQNYATPNMALSRPQYWSPNNPAQVSPRNVRNPVPMKAPPAYRPPGSMPPAYQMGYYPPMPAYGPMGGAPGYAYGQPAANPAAVVKANANSNDPRKLLASNPEAFDAMNDKNARVKLTKKYIVKLDQSALKDEDDDYDDFGTFNINPNMNYYPPPPLPPPPPHYMPAHQKRHSIDSDCSVCAKSCPDCNPTKNQSHPDDRCPSCDYYAKSSRKR